MTIPTEQTGTTSSDLDMGGTADLPTTNTAPSFAVGDGIVTTALGTGNAQGRSVLVQPDGKILVGGYAENGATNDFVVVRYNADGSLDLTFGDGGSVITAIGTGQDYAYSMALQSDGKILLTGYSSSGSTGDFSLVRFESDGSLDTAFSGDGSVTTGIGGGEDYGRDVAVQSDGRIVVAGYSWNGADYDIAVVRYNSDGSLDTTFGVDGKVTTALGAADDFGNGVVLQGDGKILVAGFTFNGADQDLALVRYNEDGSLDSTFGAGGMVTTPVGSSHDYGRAIALQADGKILVAGYGKFAGEDQFILARYDSSGNLDTTFDGDGMVSGGPTGDAFSVALQADGRILVAGVDNLDVALVRYNSDGSLDTTFGGDGKVTTPIGGGSDYAYEVTVQADGQIVVAGYGSNGIENEIVVARYNPDGSLDSAFDPRDTLGASASYTENGAAVHLDDDVQVRDAELDARNGGAGDYDGASVSIARSGGASAQDIFDFDDGTAITLSGSELTKNGQVIATFDTSTVAGQLTVSFTHANGETPTSGDVDAILRQITYRNSSDAPPGAVTLDWTFSDGNGGDQGTGGIGTASGSSVVNITAVNDAPTVASAVGDQTAQGYVAFTCQIPAGAFVDVDGVDVLSFGATLTNGSSLPAWLRFDLATRTFIGTPTNLDIGSLEIRVTAYDDFAGATDTFTLTVNGNSHLVGDASANLLYGTVASDYIDGGAGSDTLIGGLGHDSLVGGLGIDAASYATASNGVAVNLAIRAAQATGAGADTLGGIESLIGSGFADRLSGSIGANTLSGLGGNDTLSGGGGGDRLVGGLGNDKLIGGAGNDALSGGAGLDIFRFDGALGAATNKDTIGDFSVVADTIELENGVFAALATTGTLAAAAFWKSATATAAHDASDRIVYNTTTGALYYDPDGTGPLAKVQFATLTGSPDTVTNADFQVT